MIPEQRREKLSEMVFRDILQKNYGWRLSGR